MYGYSCEGTVITNLMISDQNVKIEAHFRSLPFPAVGLPESIG
jgi:hypothetical protein